ncbi:retrovirus-related pol polyprotein from transposon TNT 1-94 [Tanacetum coccineum]|uniref:Retrovirus-related pol polyprotein from transposon TNT 1-94 n=1 Tax=Tanacetum coccineum TaxID=301880 RepID=A0ABQ5I8R2_9ASTR
MFLIRFALTCFPLLCAVLKELTDQRDCWTHLHDHGEEIQRNLENLNVMTCKGVKCLFAARGPEKSFYRLSVIFTPVKQVKEGSQVKPRMFENERYIDNLERLGHPVTLVLADAQFVMAVVRRTLEEELSQYLAELPKKKKERTASGAVGGSGPHGLDSPTDPIARTMIEIFGKMDVKTAFSMDILNEEVYMEQLKLCGKYVTFLILYVEDILSMGNSIPMLQDVKSYLGKCFAMKDLGEAAYILEIKIYRDRSRWLIGLCQMNLAYIEKIWRGSGCTLEFPNVGVYPMQVKLIVSISQLESVLRLMLRFVYRIQANFNSIQVTFTGLLLDMCCFEWDGADDWKNCYKSAKQKNFRYFICRSDYIAAFDASKEAISGTQEERQSATPIVDKINVLEKQILEGKLVLVDDDRKPPKKVDYLNNLGNDDEFETVDNEMIVMDPNTSIGRLCLGENERIALNNGVKSEGEWYASEYSYTANSGKKKEIQSFTFYRMETEEISEQYITPCFVDGLHAYNGEINLKYEKNMISNKITIKLCLDYEEKGHTKGIVDSGNRIITVYPYIITFNDVRDDDLAAIPANIDVSDLPPLDIIDIPPFHV